ncbi:uncharacterized protein TNCV_3402911 [Trichonephila clavipes]|nr:uncharacterized protein TNCV_3402911 [Trichonephila clavipes]
MKFLDLDEDLWVQYLIGALPSDIIFLIARLKNFMITEKMNKRCSPECREHYRDIWEELISSEVLSDKLEAFDNIIRRSLPSGHVKTSETINNGGQVSSRKPYRLPKRKYSYPVPNERSPLRCYGCGRQGMIKSRCPTCHLNSSQRTDVANNHINAYATQIRSPRLTLVDINFCGKKGRVCGERVCQAFKEKGILFQEIPLAMSLADGKQTTGQPSQPK